MNPMDAYNTREKKTSSVIIGAEDDSINARDEIINMFRAEISPQ